MRAAFGVIVALALSACSMGELHRVDGERINNLGHGVVLDATPIIIDSKESLGERVAVGTVSGGIVGGVATAITEPGFPTQTVYRYVIRLQDSSYLIKESRSIVHVGECVDIVLKEGQDFPVLRQLNSESCGKG